MIDRELATAIVGLMNDLYQLDPAAVDRLVHSRVQCNEALADHPTVQVSEIDGDAGIYQVGLLGVLNGLAGANDEDTWGAVAAMYEGGVLTGFSLLEDRL